MLINGDFNHVKISRTLTDFKQYVTCKTRQNKILDMLYANVKEAYRSTALPPLGGSDHNLIRLTPTFRPIIKRQPATTRTIQQWLEEVEEELRACFECTDWGMFQRAHGEDIEGLSHCITDYINFCEESIVPTKKVRCFPNNKPWINGNIKALLINKKRAFRAGDTEGAKAVRRELKKELRSAKEEYRKRLEGGLEAHSTREIWGGFRRITGYKQKSTAVEGSLERANELNRFFNRFDHPTSNPPEKTGSPCSPPTPPAQDHSLGCTPGDSPTPTFITTDGVRRQLSKINVSKARGPDNINPRVLRACARELAETFQHLFSLSLQLKRVPKLWKTSCIVPVPKKGRPSTLNDYRPVALTSQVMKILERLVLQHLKPQVRDSLDPLQFAYQEKIGVEDALIYMLHRSYAHLEKPGSMVRTMFFDFSSAFNTIQPSLLAEKLSAMGVEDDLVAWTHDYLIDRPQYVRLQGCQSELLVSNTGAPQGTVLSPFLFTVYTSDFRFNSGKCHLQKFSDDSSIVGYITDDNEEDYRALVENFVRWSDTNHLQLNIGKTKEMVVDFRRKKGRAPAPINIHGEEVEMVASYKYLGVHLNDKLDWSDNTEALYKKGQSRLYFLRRLRSFNVCNKLLQLFYQSVVSSVLFFAVACWGGNTTMRDTRRINKLVKKASSVVGAVLSSLEGVAEERMRRKLHAILDNPSHPLYGVLRGLESTFSHRLILPRHSTKRFGQSFVPAAIRLHNDQRPV